MEKAPSVMPPPSSDHIRTGLGVEALKEAFLDNLYYVQGQPFESADPNDKYMALAYTVRDRLVERWLKTIERVRQHQGRVVCYFSAEFLVGRHLENNMINLGIRENVRQAMAELKIDLNDLLEQEQEPGLGNGGLGRLAACYMDSLATLEVPAIGYGIRYEFGIFDQEIRDGWQVEKSDKWLQFGNPWEIARPHLAREVKFGGRTEGYRDEYGHYKVRWTPSHIVVGIPYDTPIPGYENGTVNTLRLWKAEATDSFDFDRFNVGDYVGAVNEKVSSENISKVLYPNDSTMQGKELRLEQQFFFVSCSLQDMLRIHVARGRRVEDFDQKWAVQMNDTHPSIAVAELMRLLVDEHGMNWEPAWEITRKTLGFTNHTVLPEALERWPLSLFGSLLPRHLEIIYEINRRFLDEVRAKYPGDNDRLRRMSLIDETDGKFVRMANLATVGSHAINGVAELHTELLERYVLHDFYEIYPERFSNKTNGVTPRRWILQSNPAQSELITRHIGPGWITNLDELHKLEAYVQDPGFQKDWQASQEHGKRILAAYIKDKTGIVIDPKSMIDAQVKRIHEYKRQHLNVLHIITLYHRIKRNPNLQITPRTFLFGGKAAPGYFMAKLIIKLINSVGEVINNDPDVKDRLKVVFIPDYNVSVGQLVYTAADLSEQISTAGKEASGTGNMKFAMNGALTIGTLDGANIEIRNELGAENFFLFGLTADEVIALKERGYRPSDYYHSNEELKATLDAIGSGQFSRGDAKLFRPLLDSLLYRDDYLVLADYQAYIECQEHVSQVYLDEARWTRMSILNAARMGKFSSDRSVREYCDDIWQVTPVRSAVPDTQITASAAH